MLAVNGASSQQSEQPLGEDNASVLQEEGYHEEEADNSDNRASTQRESNRVGWIRTNSWLILERSLERIGRLSLIDIGEGLFVLYAANYYGGKYFGCKQGFSEGHAKGSLHASFPPLGP